MSTDENGAQSKPANASTPGPASHGLFPERSPEIIEVTPQVARRWTRRDFLAFGAGAIVGLGAAASQLPPTTLQRLGLKFWPRNQWLLNKALRFDDDVAELLYSPNRLVPTYTKSQITPLKNNYNGTTPDPGYIPIWRLTLDGLSSGLAASLDIRTLLTRFQIHDQITRLVCVEGWSAIAGWSGLKFEDLLQAYPPVSQARWALIESSVNLDPYGKPDPYYVSIDLLSSRHPQTLLATHYNGQPLTVEHGAPLRLIAPMKLGLKNIKAITRIAKGPKRPMVLETVDLGPLGVEDVEVAVEHCGLCHSDLSVLNNDWGISQYPAILGHEVVGRVTAMGPNAKGLKIGQHVGVGWNSGSCMHCHPHDTLEVCSAVERIATFAAKADSEQLTPDSRQLYKRNILDSLGCAIAGLQGLPFQALREQFEEYRASGRCTMIGGGKTSADQAALFNCSLVRYVDLLDSYMATGGLCHPSDNFGTVLAAAENAGASGEEFMVALAVAYEIQCRFTAVVPVMAKGFNHAIQLAISAAASTGKLLGLSAGEIANAIAIATVDNISLTCIHAEPVSEWKGFSPGMTGMRAVYSASLAKRGFTGPRGLFEGPFGLEMMFAQPIQVNWEDPSLDIVEQTIMKKYCSLIHAQPVLEAVLNLKRSNGLTASGIENVRCDVFQGAFDFAGGGSFGRKDHPQVKAQGDYNLKYLIAAALLDDQVGPAPLDPLRIRSLDAQALLARVAIHPDEHFSARYPGELGARITILTKDQRVFVKEQFGYEGGLTNPMSWERTVEKFHWLSEAFAEEDLRNAIVRTVKQLDSLQVADLMHLLAQVHRTPAFPRTHPGIQ